MILSATVLALAAASPSAAMAAPDTDGPVLAFRDANIARARRLSAEDPVAAARWAALRARADAALAKPPTGERQIDAALEALALSYRMTRETRYAAAARDLLLVRAGRDNWLTDKPLARRDPPWRSDLGMGYAAASYGIAYDAIRETLTPGERRRIVEGLVKGAIEPILADWIDGRQRIHALDTMGHNWWAHIVFGAGVGALAIQRDDPRAREWTERIDAASVEWFRFAGSRIESKPPTFGSDGGYSETVGYAELGLHSLLLFRRAWGEAMPRPATPIPGLDRAADYFLAAAYPRTGGWVSLNFGDSRPPSCGCRSLADLWALGDRNPAYLRYIDGFAGVPDKDAWSDATNLPYLPDAAERAAARDPALPTALTFPSQGLATLRSGWAPDATLFAIKAGHTWNHNHADAGSFILHHRGRVLLSDSGHSSYSTPEYDGYYRQSVAHNVVTVDGKAEPPSDLYDGSHFPGKIDHLIDTPGFRYLWADATGPTSRYFQRNFRNVLWVGDTILVLDDLRAWTIGQYEWLLHYQGSARREGQAVRIADEGAEVDVRPLFPQPLPDGGLPTDYPEAMRMVEHQGLKDGEPRTRIPFIGFQPTELREREKIMVAIQPRTPGKAPARIDRLEGLNWIGVRLTGAERTTEIYMNLLADGRVRHRNANATLAGYETDAYMLALSWPAGAARGAEPDQVFVANGSYVRRGGRVVIDGLSKMFAHLDLRAGALTLSGQPDLNARFACRGPLRLAGAATALDCRDGTATLVRREAR